MLNAVRGTRDLLPAEAKIWRNLEETAVRTFLLYGYGEVRTPLFEKSELFARAVGETTDIVEKEMYTFPDRHGESLSLRPEGTASVVRAFLENGLTQQLPWRVFYRGPMFRYERPQKGRYRQFHQIGCELFGPEGPGVDAEMMAMIFRYLGAIGLEGRLALEVNTLGCPDCRPGYRQTLTRFLEERQAVLCDNCRGRLQRNPLRVLDCKEEGCRTASADAPATREHLCTPCADHFSGLLAHVEALDLPLTVNPRLVRGLDYYTRTAFEVTTRELGAQNAVAAGGRYDHLVSTLGGPPTPAIGFAMGLERLALLTMGEAGVEEAPRAYVVAVGEIPRIRGLLLAEALRNRGVWVEMDGAGGSMKAQMKRAGRSRAATTLLLGEREVAAGVVLVKDMESGEQQELSWDETLLRLAM